MNNYDYLIIGAGPCGLGAAWRLEELGIKNYLVLEKTDISGGLARSFRDKAGFIWDIGGHVLHSHYSYYDRMFEKVMSGQYLNHDRSAWVWIFDRYVPYPLQNNIRHFSPLIRKRCLNDLESTVSNTQKALSENFADYLKSSYGLSLYKYFFYPYNYKVWCTDPVYMSSNWVGDRVAAIDIKIIKNNIKYGRDDTGWGPNNKFKYPVCGGAGDLWMRVAQTLSNHIRYLEEVTEIDALGKRIYFKSGLSVGYRHLLVTVPLDKIHGLISGINIANSKGYLKKTSVAIVGIGFSGQVPSFLSTKSWIYFPDAFLPFFRVTVLSNYSINNTPKNTWSLMFESTYTDKKPLPQGLIVKNIIDTASKIKLIPENARIVDRFLYKSVYGYPVPTLHRDDYVNPTVRKLESYDIYPRGRFGLWKYEISNQDHTFMQGVEWVDRLVLGKKEKIITQ